MMVDSDFWQMTFRFILEGVPATLAFTAIGTVGGLCIGLTLAFLSMSHHKALQWFSKMYLSIFRGTPLLVQLAMIYFAFPQIFHVTLSAFAAGALAFSFNSAAYVSETLRAGILAVDKGQLEAARVLEIPKFYMYRDIVFPQALRNILPALMNEMISLLKETALISTIGGVEIMRRANLFAAEHYAYFEPLVVAACYYYIMVSVLSYAASRLEKRVRYDHN